MNWDISIGRLKQVMGRVMQAGGRRLAYRRVVLDGEAMEYAGRLQMRYGMLKHQAQWGGGLSHGALRPVAVAKAATSSADPRSLST